MSKFAILVEQEKINNRKKNIEQVKLDLQSTGAAYNDIIIKIKNFIDRFDGMFLEQDIIQKILNDDAFAAMFAKDPTKQNISEKMCSDYIGIKRAPQSGKNCIRFTDTGDIVSSKKEGGCKSVDFILPEGVYATQKYTGANTGGAQDNQFDDVVAFLKNGSIHHKVAAIVDGWYWEDNHMKERLSEMFADNSNVYIFSADDYKEGRVKFAN